MDKEIDKNSKLVLGIGLALAYVPLLLGLKIANVFFYSGILVLLIQVVRLQDKALEQLSSISLNWKFFGSIFILMLATWSAAIATDYYSIEFSGFDTGIYANLLTNFVKTGEYFSSILQLQGLGNHFTANLMLLAPIYTVYPDFSVLLIAKLLAFFACPILLYKLSQELVSKSSRLNFIAPLLWLISKPLGRTLEYEFQVSSLALPFILLTFLYAARLQYFRMLVFLIFLLGFKEHMPLAWVSLGIFIFLYQRKPKLGAALIVAGIIAGLIIYTQVMPAFTTSGNFSHVHRFAPFSLVFSKIKLVFLALLSVGLLPFASPKSLLFIIPAFSLAFVSNDPNMLSFSFHYQDLPMSIVFVGVVCGLSALSAGTSWISRLENKKRFLIIASYLFIALLTNNRFPARNIILHYPSNNDLQVIKDSNEFLKQYDDEIPLWTIDALVPYFSYAKNVRSITETAFLEREKSMHTIVLAEGINFWPIEETGFQQLRSKLDAETKNGKYELKSHGALSVYQKK